MSLGTFTLALMVSLVGADPDLQDSKVKKLLKRADRHYARRAESGMIQRAIQSYQKALVLDEECTEAYWKIARANYWIGLNAVSKEAKLKIYREAIDYCKMAISIDDNCLPARYVLGSMYGLFGQAKGIFQSLDLAKAIQREMEWVIRHDEKWNYGGGHRVLGRLYFLLPGIKGGDNQKALDHLRRAVELAPDLHNNHLFLAEVYAAEGRRDLAKKHLQIVLKMKDHSFWGPESKFARMEARKLLSEIEN